jgi:hypothetical protein
VKGHSGEGRSLGINILSGNLAFFLAFFLPKVARSFYICSCTAVPEETAEPIVDLLNRGVSVVGIAAREDLTAKRSRPEMAPQRFEKIESAPGNGMVWEDWNPQDVVHGRAAGRARLRLTSRLAPPHLL